MKKIFRKIVNLHNSPILLIAAVVLFYKYELNTGIDIENSSQEDFNEYLKDIKFKEELQKYLPFHFRVFVMVIIWITIIINIIF